MGVNEIVTTRQLESMKNKMWKDSETNLDLLNFSYLSDQVVALATDDNLTPATIGIYGDWGSGKSSLMKMAKEMLDKDESILTVEFNGWLFEGYDDAKTALCGTILDEMHDKQTKFAFVKDKIALLKDKIDVQKILSKGIKYGLDYLLTGGLGTITELTLAGLISSIKEKAGNVTEDEIKTLLDAFKNEEKKRTEIKNFNKEFKDALKNSKCKRLVVFIDELDRCTPETVLDIFEAIRLFLYVEGTTFVIGADERLINYAVKTKYQDIPGHTIDISKEYLEKLVQYPVKVPQLNELEVRQYITCLLLENEGIDSTIISKALHTLKVNEELTLDVFLNNKTVDAQKIKECFDLSNQISSTLAFLMKGNPRHCKRFLNTLMMRLNMAGNRQISLNRNVLAKLMLAEYYKPKFIDVLMQPDGYKELKLFEDGNADEIKGILKDWKEDPWVQEWAKGTPKLTDVEDIASYFYFTRESRKLYSVFAEVLSPEAQKLLRSLLGNSDTVKNNAIISAKKIGIAEQALLVKALFDELRKEENIDVNKFKTYIELSIGLEMYSDAVATIKSLPTNKITIPMVGQLSQFVKKLDASLKQDLIQYLKQDAKLRVAVDGIL